MNTWPRNWCVRLSLICWCVLAGGSSASADAIDEFITATRDGINVITPLTFSETGIVYAGEGPDKKPRTIKTDDEGRVILSPTGTQMDSDGRIKVGTMTPATYPCVKQMEAAMRLNNEFMMWNTDAHADLDESGVKIAGAWLRKMYAAKDAWEMVKGQCWSHP